MARGWESKSVESQMEEAQLKAAPTAPELTPEQMVRARERAGLLLSKTRILRDLESAANPRYREILQAALDHVEQRLSDPALQV